MRDRLLYTLAAAGVPVDRCPASVGPGLVRGDLTFVGTPTPAQLSACDSILASFNWSAAAHAAWLLTRTRASAADQFETPDGSGKVLRALVLVLVDEINTLRDWVTQFKATTALATNLANFQSRVAALPNVPQRTGAQARSAVTSKLAAGDAD